MKEAEQNVEQMGELYRRLRQSLMRYASRYFERPQEIEDVVQEAFVRVIEAEATRNVRVSDSYLYRTTRNLALNILSTSESRLTSTVGDLLTETVSLQQSSLEDQLESRQRLDLVCEALRHLPVKCQRVFILRRVYGLSHKEISERLDISLKTVEAHLTKAIVRCTDYMDAAEQRAPEEHG